MLARLLGASAAHAQPADPKPDARAVAFFDEGRKLMAAGRFAEAIPKLQESVRVTRTVGALLNLGRCLEETGRAASAWATYRPAAALAVDLHDARASVARGYADAVEPRVAMLTIDAHEVEKVAGLVVTLDGEALGEAARGTPMPIDPGDHAVEARAPGRTPVRRVVHVDGAARVTFAVPPLAEAKVEASVDPKANEPEVATGSAVRTAGFVVAGAGLAGLAFGGIAGLVALGHKNDAAAACTSYPDHCDPAGAANGPNDAAKTWATASTIGFAAGGAALVTGVVLVLASPSSHEAASSSAALRVTPLAGPAVAGVVVGGAF